MLSRYKKAAVCLSGGADSSLVTVLASKALGRENVIALTALTEFFTKEELERAKEIAARTGVLHKVLVIDMLKDERIVKNPWDRCYICKGKILSKIKQEAKGYPIMDGGNTDDFKENRPGARAVEENGVISPLKEAGMGKEQVYSLLNILGFNSFARPSNSCLATRIAAGQEISKEKLDKIYNAEKILNYMGYPDVRVRLSGNDATVCIKGKPPLLVEVKNAFRDIGFRGIKLEER